MSDENLDGGIESKVAWNMAALVNVELARLRNMANTAYISGDLSKAVRCLITIRQNSEHTFSSEEKQTLLKMQIV